MPLPRAEVSHVRLSLATLPCLSAAEIPRQAQRLLGAGASPNRRLTKN